MFPHEHVNVILETILKTRFILWAQILFVCVCLFVCQRDLEKLEGALVENALRVAVVVVVAVGVVENGVVEQVHAGLLL